MMKKQQRVARDSFIPVLWIRDGHETPLTITIAEGIRQMAAQKSLDVKQARYRHWARKRTNAENAQPSAERGETISDH